MISMPRRRAGALARRAGLGLSRELWLVEIGILLNMLGYGAVLPFEVIYLHNGRGFSLGTAGLVVGLLTGAAVLSAPVAGPLIDRFGARTTAAGAGAALAAGYAGLAFVHTPAQAFAAAALAGAGNGALNPSQSTLLTSLAVAELRHRASAVSRVAGNAGIGIGGAVGGLVASYGLPGFMLLFLLNAATYLIYIAVLVVVVREVRRPRPAAAGYRLVIRDRAFLHLLGIYLAITAIGWGFFSWVIPPYARNHLGISGRLIGLQLLANAATVMVAQVPISRLAEGRRRVVMIAAAAALFCGACLLVLTAQPGAASAYPKLVIAQVAVGLGECCFTTTLSPLIADLAPEGLRGRYMAAAGLCFWIGLAIAPTVGLQLLAAAPAATFIAAAAIAAAAGVSAVTLQRRLPVAARLTPKPGNSP